MNCTDQSDVIRVLLVIQNVVIYEQTFQCEYWQAKNRLSKIIDEVVFAKKRVLLNSHGQPKTAMISLEELEKFEEMERLLFPSKQGSLIALNKAAQLREQIYYRKKETVSDSFDDLKQIRKERPNEF